jgi:O-antigen ligase
MKPRHRMPERHALIAIVFLAGAVVLGGGGTPSPGPELLLQLLFVTAAIAWLWVPPRHGERPLPDSRTAWLVCGLVLAVPVIQLIPLPPSLWSGAAGQQDRVAALALVGRAESWQPLSHSPARTLAALLAMVPALGMFLATAALDSRGRWWVAGAAAMLALAAALLGAAQVSLGADAPYLYSDNHRTLTGFQANRNAAADVLLIGMAAGAAFLAPSLGGQQGSAAVAGRRNAAVALGGVTVLLFFATILTASRAGIALLPLVLGGAWIMLRPALADLGRWRLLPPAAALGAVAIVVLAAIPGGNTALGSVAERFVFSDDARRELWRDGWFAAMQAWPFGVGMGGAQSALIAAERLEVLQPALPNRVHNDYLELMLEGGLPALAALAAIAGALVWAARSSWRQRPADRHLTIFGAIVLLVVAAHSFVDYPLRSMALACLVGTGAGMLMSTPRRPAHEPGATIGGMA